jgi:thiol-disulfide isomerase/thioredoxin
MKPAPKPNTTAATEPSVPLLQKIGRWRLVSAAAALVILIVLAGIYGIAHRPSNPAETACGGAVNTAKRIAPLIRGEVAALAPAQTPFRVPDLAFKDAKGRDLRLADWRGRTVLLNLWATWCVPCRREMPALDALQALLGGADFEVVAVNIDTRDPQKPLTFLKDVAIAHLAYYSDPSARVFEELKTAGKAFDGGPSRMGERRRREARQCGHAATAAVIIIGLSGPPAPASDWASLSLRHWINLPKCESFILSFLRLCFSRAGIVVRAAVANDADGLNLNLDPRPSEIRHRDESAARIVSVVEEVLAHFHESIAITGFLDEHRHGHDVVQAPADALHNAVDLRKHLLYLRFEIVGDVVALAVLGGGLSGDPNDHSAGRHHARRKRARQLERRLLHVLGRVRDVRKQYS